MKQLVLCLGLALAGLAFSPVFDTEALVEAARPPLPPVGGVVAGSQGGSSGPATTVVNTAGGNGGNANAGSHGVNVSPQTNAQVTGRGNNQASNQATTQSHNRATGGNGGNAASKVVTQSGRGGDAVTQAANACCPNGSLSNSVVNPGGSGILAGSRGGNSGDATTVSNTEGGSGGNANAGSYGVNVSPQTNVQVTGHGDNQASNKAVTQSYNRAEGGDGGNADSDITTRSGRGGDALTGAIGGCCPDGSNGPAPAFVGGGNGGILALARGGDSGDADTVANTEGGDGGNANAGSYGENTVVQNNIQGPVRFDRNGGGNGTNGLNNAHVNGNHNGLFEGDNHASNEATTQSFNEAEGGDGGDADSDITTRSGRGGDAINIVEAACCPGNDLDTVNTEVLPIGGGGGILALARGGDSGDAETVANTEGGDGGDAKAGSFGENTIVQNNLQGGSRGPIELERFVNGDHEGDVNNRASNRATTQSFNKAEGGDGGDADSDITTRSGRGGDAINIVEAACCPDGDGDFVSTRVVPIGGRGILAFADGGDSGDADTVSNTQGGDGGDAKAGSFGENTIVQNNLQGGSVRPIELAQSFNGNHEGDGTNRASNRATTQSFNEARGGDGGDADSDITTRSGRGGDAVNFVEAACCPEENHVVCGREGRKEESVTATRGLDGSAVSTASDQTNRITMVNRE